MSLVARALVAFALLAAVAPLGSPLGAQFDSIRVDSVRPGLGERILDLDPNRAGVQFRWCIRYTPFGGSQPSGTTRVDSASIFVQAPPQTLMIAQSTGAFPQVNQCGAATGGSSVLGDTATIAKGSYQATVTAVVQFAFTPNPNNAPPVFAGGRSRTNSPVHFYPAPAVITITGDSIRSTPAAHTITVTDDLGPGQQLFLRRLGKLRVGEPLVPTGFTDTLRFTPVSGDNTWVITPLNFGALFRYDVTSDTVPGIARGRDRALVRAGTVTPTTLITQPAIAPNQPYAPRFDVFGRALPGMVVRIAICSSCDALNDSVTTAADSTWRITAVGWPIGGQNSLLVVGRDADGFVDTTAAVFPVNQNQAPVVRIATPAVSPVGPGRDSITVAVGAPLTFTATGTDDGTIASWLWDFGNQTSATVQNPGVRSYPAVGRFLVTLRAFDDLGAASNGDTLIVKVSARPVVRIVEPLDGSTQMQRFDVAGRATPGATVTLTSCSACSAQGTTRVAALDSTWRYVNVLFAPAPQGVDIVASVSDTTPLTGTDMVNVDVMANIPPQVLRLSPAADSVLIPQGDSVFFAVLSTDSDGTIASRQWRRGVLALGTADTLGWRAHPDTGNVVYGFRAIDNIGDSTIARFVVRVVANAPPVATITRPAADTTVLVGDLITFEATATDPNSPLENIIWRFGDGRAAGSLTPPPLAYPSVGTFVVTFRATDPFGLFDEDTVIVQVRSRPAVRVITPPSNGSVQQRSDITGRATPGATVRVSQCVGCSVLDSVRVAAGDSSFAFLAVTWPLPGANNSLTLTVTDGFGFTNTATVSFSVIANAPPVATITAPAADTVVLIGAPITFAATAFDPNGPVASVLWRFGDGRTSALLAPPALSYPTAGSFVVTLRATDALGLFAEDTVLVQVRQAPAVRITAPTEGATLPTRFSIAGRASPGATVRVVQCTGCSALDSTRVAAGDSSFTFAATIWSLIGPNNSLTLSVTDGFGFTAQASVAFTVAGNQAPVVTRLSPSADSLSVQQGDSLFFAARATDGDGTIVTRVWRLAAAAVASSDTLGWRLFADSGRSAFTFTATDDFGDSTRLEIIVRVIANVAPTATITAPAADTTVLVGAPIAFAATATDPNGPVSSVLWRFGDGRTSALLTPPALSYATVGSYVVTFRATDSRGLLGEDTVLVNVRGVPAIRLIAPAQGSTQNATFDVTGRATPGATVRITQCSACGKRDSTRVAAGDSSFTFAATSWAQGGANSLTVRVTDAFGSSDSVAVTFSIGANRAPSVSITQPTTAPVIRVGDSLAFLAVAVDPDGDALRIRWTFAPDDTIIGANAGVRRFTTAGSRTVVVRATDPAGAFGEDTVIVLVLARGPNVDIASPGSATRVDGHDVVFVLRALTTQDLRADVNGDGVVTAADVALVRAAFGSTVPAPLRVSP